MTDFDNITDEDEFTPTDEDFAEFHDSLLEDVVEDDEPGYYNLAEDADADCLAGDCEHFCGEPTQDDLDRLYRQGKGHLVEAYENGIQYV